MESTHRPDGARRGPRPFLDVLNGTKRSVALDFTHAADLARRARRRGRAVVVFESSRLRPWPGWDWAAENLMAGQGPSVWVALSGYGRQGGAAQRVAFGDDAAAAGGVGRPPRRPTCLFCADAIADPLSGLAAADACLEALEAGGRWLLDVSMAAVAAELAGPTLPVPPGLSLSAPRWRPSPGAAPDLGTDTKDVLARFGLA